MWIHGESFASLHDCSLIELASQSSREVIEVDGAVPSRNIREKWVVACCQLDTGNLAFVIIVTAGRVANGHHKKISPP